VADCHQAGILVKMCTGDSLVTAQSIAQQCGIYTPGGMVLEGPHFRVLSQYDRNAIVPRLQVLARCEPEDKRLLVETLKELGEVVCAAGDGTNDGPALKAAHVSLSMGIAGNEVAKEASDIILPDDNFSSIVKIIVWGRCLNDSTRKFLQFQISAKVAVAATVLASSLLPSLVLSVAQLLWFLVIAEVFSALSLAMDLATPALLKHRPRSMNSLSTIGMIRRILVHSTCQFTTILLLYFFGSQIFGHQHIDNLVPQDNPNHTTQTLFFSAFVFTLVFNSLNYRRLKIERM
jgi:P-type Ca2+ transporter type 2C